MCVATAARAGGTLLRWHKMGEEEGGTNNSPVFQTLDSPVDGGDVQAIDLFANISPTYRTISGRPDGGGGIGIEFNAASSQSLSGLSLNWPQESALSDSQGGFYDLAGISNRALQFWVRPTLTAVQSLVMDTNQHGVRINSNGKFSMRYAGVDYESTLAMSPNTWYHIELARPSGVANRARLYINGNAVAVSPAVDYAADNLTPLTVGSNSTSDGEFFSGIIDDLRMSVFGTTTSSSPVAYGAFNFATDNAFAASSVTGLKGVAGDVTNDGFLTQADKDAFIAGWLSKRLVNGFQIGDLTSYGQGDLNLDGITNIQDLVLMQNALSGAGIGTITGAELAGVPEPATCVLLLWAIMAMPLRSRRFSRSGNPASSVRT
jgi:hypothetical protein